MLNSAMSRFLAVLILGLPAGAAPDESAPSAPGGSPSPDARAQEIRGKLAGFKITLEFEDTPLMDVLDFVRDAAGIDIVVDPRVREADPGDAMRVTFKVRDLPLRSALKLLLETKGLTTTIRDGVLVVLAAADLDREVVTRIYDVRDLLLKIEDYQAPRIELKPAGTGESGIVLYLPEKEPLFTEDTIVDQIRNNTAKGDWDANPKASIQITDGRLVVTQSARVHREIAELLGGLRQSGR